MGLNWDDGLNSPLWSVLLGAVLLLVARGRHRQPTKPLMIGHAVPGTLKWGGPIRHRINDAAFDTPRGYKHGFTVTASCPEEAVNILWAKYLDMNAERRTA